MTYAPSPAGSRRQPQRRGGWRRVLLVALTAGVVVAALTGTAGFTLTRTLNGGDNAVRCGDSSLCFAGFDAATVTGFLADRGYECQRRVIGDCRLVTSSATYELDIASGSDGQGVRRYEARVRFSPVLAMPERGEEFLTWFAGLPFGEGSADADEAGQWLAAHRQPGGDHTERATIGGFDFVLVHREGTDRSVVLVVTAGGTWL